MKSRLDESGNQIGVFGSGSKIRANFSLSSSYDIIFEERMLDIEAGTLAGMIGGKKCVFILSPRVTKLYHGLLQSYLQHWLEPAMFSIVTLPVTEETKTFETAMKMCSVAAEFGLDRKSLLVAMGGGVLMDTVGFAASVYMRRINFLRIPTTLVGQIDAGIGIKTGVNFGDRKNFIGSFHAPAGVINDSTFLRTLDPREISNGLSEIVKIAVVSDRGLFDMLHDSRHSLLSSYRGAQGSELVRKINSRSSERMIEQLSDNPYEKELERLVDFGHTFSPFMEVQSGHRIRHGHAVALDIALSTEISSVLGLISDSFYGEIMELLEDIDFTLYDAEVFDAQGMYQSLDSITLRRGGRLNLVLPCGNGGATFLRERSEFRLSTLKSAILRLKERYLEDGYDDEASSCG